jgi:hypothetical protein
VFGALSLEAIGSKHSSKEAWPTLGSEARARPADIDSKDADAPLLSQILRDKKGQIKT